MWIIFLFVAITHNIKVLHRAQHCDLLPPIVAVEGGRERPHTYSRGLVARGSFVPIAAEIVIGFPIRNDFPPQVLVDLMVAAAAVIHTTMGIFLNFSAAATV